MSVCDDCAPMCVWVYLCAVFVCVYARKYLSYFETAAALVVVVADDADDAAAASYNLTRRRPG